jgi:hypothetical protein
MPDNVSILQLTRHGPGEWPGSAVLVDGEGDDGAVAVLHTQADGAGRAVRGNGCFYSQFLAGLEPGRVGEVFWNEKGHGFVQHRPSGLGRADRVCPSLWKSKKTRR